ncbi:MAG: DUF4097 family beta strand repeat-containing protein [Bacteroidota bacterium]
MTSIRKFIYVLVLPCLFSKLLGQENIRQTYDPQGVSTLRFENLNGSVKVVGTDAPTLSLEVRLVPSDYALNFPDYEANKPSFEFVRKGETVFLNIVLPEEESNNDFWREPATQNWWGNKWWEKSSWEPTYAYQMNVSLKVPRKLNLMISTMNSGDIQIQKMEGTLDVKNLNGDISLEDVVSRVRTKTINGDISVNYQQNPSRDSFFKTFNGEIYTRFQKGVAAKMTFLSSRGEFFTNIPELEYQQQEITKQKDKEGTGIAYKIQNTASITSRKGTVALHFETYNGDVYAKE